MNLPPYHKKPADPSPDCRRDGCRFRVWAPGRNAVELHLVKPSVRLPMTKDKEGYFFIDAPGVQPGRRYFYYLPEEDKRYPDPCSAFQPEGVDGPSEVVDHRVYRWADGGWKGLPFESLVFYELHIGAFTPEGTFDAIIPRLEQLAETGINALQLMPVAQCPGSRNWGYDGVFLYSVANAYGGPEGLKRLVDASHRAGIAVFLDVVYNHIGMEGNCLGAFGPYFSDKYHTPWGKAMNFDGPWSDGVREFVTGNALYWAEHFHIDGLRLDAIHEIYDRNAIRIWDELYDAIREWEQRSGRRYWLVAESDANDPRVVKPPGMGGMGFDAQWLDDFHHALYVLIDPAGRKHYRDFGAIDQLAKAWSEGYVHSGEYVRFRHRKHGASSAGIGGDRFVVFNQNHDLPGNRPGGERLGSLVSLPSLKLAAAAVLLSPYVPLLFMGEEYGEDAPFFFFSDYRDKKIVAGLREGRKAQFASFDWDGEPRDPQDEAVFRESVLHWEKRGSGDHAVLLDWHRRLIRLRREHPLLRDLSKKRLRADVSGPSGLSVYRWSTGGDLHLVCVFNFSPDVSLPVSFGYTSAEEGGEWRRLLASTEVLPATLHSGSALQLPPLSMAVYERTTSSILA